MKVPEHLSKKARKLFREILDLRGDDRIFNEKLLKTLEALDRVDSARAQIDRDGMTIVNKFNEIKVHPLLPIERDSRAAFFAGLKSLDFDNEAPKPVGRVTNYDDFVRKLKKKERKEVSK